MSYLSFMHFFAFLVYLYLAVFILIKDPKSSLNRVCSAFLVCFCIWSFGPIFIHNPATSKDIARLLLDIDCIGWISFSSFFLWFILIFTEKKKILKSKLFYLIIFILPLFLIYKQWTDFLVIGHVMQPYGWGIVWSKSIWPSVFYIYYISFMIIGLYLIFNFRRKTEDPIKKKQSKVIFTAAITTLTLASLTDVLLPELNIHTIPELADVIVLIWAGGVVYAIVKYKLFVLTPVTAADNIIETVVDSLLLVDSEGKIRVVNQATLDLLGYKEDEIIGQPTDILFEEEGVSPFKGAKFKKLTEEGTIRDHEMKCRTKKGEIIPISFSGSVMRDKDGNLVGIVGIGRDIREIKRLMQKEKELASAALTAAEAEKKRAEELEKSQQASLNIMEDLERQRKELNDALRELRGTQAQLIQSEKMATIGRLAGGVAHEINTPLGTILTNTEMLMVKGPATGSQKEYLEMIKESSLRCKAIVEQLLKYSRLPGPEFEMVGVGQVIDECYLLLKRQLTDEGIKVNREYGPIPEIKGNANELRQVFTNIILNARDAIKKTFDDKKRQGKIRIRAYQEGRSLVVEVQDDGCGIAPEDIGKIFDPFFTTKDIGGGTGLGLSISQRIIERHSGKIEARSKVGQGTTMRIELPIKKRGE